MEKRTTPTELRGVLRADKGSAFSRETERGPPICKVKGRSAKEPLAAFCVGKPTAINASRISAEVFFESVDPESRLKRHLAQRPNFKAQSKSTSDESYRRTIYRHRGYIGPLSKEAGFRDAETDSEGRRSVYRALLKSASG
jgi:hypothetical protein